VEGRLRVVALDVAPRGDRFHVLVSDPAVPENGYSELRGLDGDAVRPVDFGIDFDFWSADGAHFYDVRGTELYRHLSRDLEVPGVLVATWTRGSAGHLSPDRQTLLVSDRGGRDWWALTLAAGALVPLPGIGGGEVLVDPVWSPDGSRVAFQVEFPEIGEGDAALPDTLAIYSRLGGLLARFEVPQDAVDGEAAARIINPEATSGARLRDYGFDGGAERLALRQAWSDVEDSGQGGYRFSVVEADSGAVIADFWSDPDRSPLDSGLVSGPALKNGDDGDGETDLGPYYGASRHLWVPGNESVLLFRGPASATAAYLTGERRGFEADEERRSFQTTSTGHLLHFQRADPDQPFESDWWQLRTLANLTADLRLRRGLDGQTVILEGTATDLHFEDYRLDYAPVEAPEDWRPIAPASARPVVDGVFQPWVAPAAGSWWVRLTVTDRAGNSRRVVRRVATGLPTGVVDVFAAPDRFSPNGDGVLETTGVHYETLGPWTVDFQV
ncbi:MAG: hypothetical protein AAFX50_17150, partial [Acidobacteriota bacterium]